MLNLNGTKSAPKFFLKMKVLVIDNGTHYKKRLNGLLNRHRITTISYKDINPDLHQQDYDLIVLSGAYGGHAVKYGADDLLVHEQELQVVAER